MKLLKRSPEDSTGKRAGNVIQKEMAKGWHINLHLIHNCIYDLGYIFKVRGFSSISSSAKRHNLQAWIHTLEYLAAAWFIFKNCMCSGLNESLEHSAMVCTLQTPHWVKNVQREVKQQGSLLINAPMTNCGHQLSYWLVLGPVT